MSGKKLTLFFFSIFILFSSISLKSQEGDSLYYVDPNAFVAREIFNKKIVMLGDGGHHQPAVYHYVFGTLYKWLDMCKSKPDEEHLTMIVENDGEFADLLAKLIEDGDMDALLGKIYSEFYLEDLEYFLNLRKFSLTVDSLNLHRDKKISFKVKAFEQAGYANADKVYSLPQKEDELWFVNERDSVTAEGIINYINSNPGERILIFYGGAHLYDKRVDKIRMVGLQMLTPEEGQGYYLAYFLNQKYGVENILKIMPWGSNLYMSAQKQDFPYPGRQSFIAKSEDLGVADSLGPSNGYIYNIQYDYLPLIEGGRICSKRILDKTIEMVKHTKSLLPGYIAQRYYYWNLGNLYYLTGKHYRNDSLLNQSLSDSNFNPTDFLYSNRFDSLLSPLNNMIPQINWFYRNYGVDASKDSIMILLNRFKELSAMFLIQRVKFTNSIGIYWFGYPDEKIKAKEYLVKFSGEDFAEPEKYLQWYRMKYYGYEY
jgi:hypothetical protein